MGAPPDISERERLEAALHESEELAEQRLGELEAVYASAPIGLCVMDADLRWARINERMAAMNGPSVSAHLARSIWEVLPDLAPDVAPVLRRVLATGEPILDAEGSSVNPTRPGGRSHWIASYYPLRAHDGRAIGVNVAVIEITERKRAEGEREQLLEAERAARAEAERANRMKDEFLATLSHELRTPLSAVLGYAQMLRSGQVKPEGVARALEIIERNARVQGEIVSDLLDMSRIVSGKLKLDLVPADLSAIVDAAVESVQESAESKRLRIDVDVARLPRPVIGDQARLQQVLSNLLTNAIKFTPAGGGVSLAVRPAGEDVEVRVADTGQGIAAEFLPHVFDRFRQADASSSRQHRGLGLGLAICKQLVEMHGGTIRAESPGPGRGATFTVRLSAGSMAEDSGVRASERADADDAGAALRGVEALVVDDEPDARELVQHLLEARGVVVRAASSAAEALSAVEQGVPQVLVSDIGMPHEDGYALIRKLRSLPPERGGLVPAIALTAFARPEDQERARDAGFQRHLTKPIDAGQLYAAITALTARRGAC